MSFSIASSHVMNLIWDGMDAGNTLREDCMTREIDVMRQRDGTVRCGCSERKPDDTGA